LDAPTGSVTETVVAYVAGFVFEEIETTPEEFMEIPEICEESEVFKMVQVFVPEAPPVEVKLLVVAVPYVADIDAAPLRVSGELTSAGSDVEDASPAPMEFTAFNATV
jgi:hypothetical protein